jgi:acetyltransferase-like isoleucine patch superfamily enzyme
VGTRSRRSHGSGRFSMQELKSFGAGSVIEKSALVFHPERIDIGARVYVGHGTILDGYHDGAITIGDDTWIGPQCFLHGAGGVVIGKAVGIGPGVAILTSEHEAAEIGVPVICSPLRFAAVSLGDGCDIGVRTIVLPGVTIGEGAIVGAGAVVTSDVPPFEVWAGVPACRIRSRGASSQGQAFTS